MGTINDLEVQFLVQELGTLGAAYNDGWYKWLGQQGYTGAYNDRKFAYLGSLGHKGSLTDRRNKFYCGAPTDIKPVPSGWYTSSKTYESGSPLTTIESELALDNIEGGLIRTKWSTIQALEGGPFDFTVIDDQVALFEAAGKPFSLSLIDSYNAPAWLATGAGTTFTYNFQGSRTVPVIWDAYYQTHKAAMVAAIGDRYNSHPLLRSVYFTYACMTNGAEFHWRVTEGDYKTVSGYSDSVQKQAAEDIFDMYVAAFPNTHIAIESHTVFSDVTWIEQLYDYAFSQVGAQVGLAIWWEAFRIATDNSGSEADADVWPLCLRAKDQGSFLVGQTVGQFTSQAYRFDLVNPITAYTDSEAFTQEMTFFKSGDVVPVHNPLGHKMDAIEFWTADGQNTALATLYENLEVGAIKRNFTYLDGSSMYYSLDSSITVDRIVMDVYSLTGATTGLPTGAPAPTANALDTLDFVYSGTMQDIGKNGASFFEGYIGNVKMYHGTVLVADLTLSEDFSTTTKGENSATSNRATTHNISVSKLFTSTPEWGWLSQGNLLTNGLFGSDLSGWTIGAGGGWTQSGKEAVGTALDAANKTMTQSNIFTIGLSYLVRYIGEADTGGFGVKIASGTVPTAMRITPSVESIEEIVIADLTDFQMKRSTTVNNATLDRVSVREALQIA